MYWKDEIPKLLFTDIYKYMSEQCSLTQQQIKECFDTYENILMTLMESEERPSEMIFPIPKVGNIVIKEKKGKKSGSIVNYPTRGKHSLTEKVLEEDRPNYQVCKVKLFKRYNDALKKSSIEKQKTEERRKSLDFSFKEKDNGSSEE